MKHCPNADCSYLARYDRVAEYVDGIEVCSDCGSPLRHGAAPQMPPPEYRELEAVYETSSQIQAYLIRSILEGGDLTVHVAGEALQGALGELPPTMPSLRVQVLPEEVQLAASSSLRASGRSLCQTATNLPMTLR